jgi:hypothetical protein
MKEEVQRSGIRDQRSEKLEEKSRGQISEVRSHRRINFDIRSAWPHKLSGTARVTKRAHFNVARLDWVPGIPDEPPFNLRLAKKTSL